MIVRKVTAAAMLGSILLFTSFMNHVPGDTISFEIPLYEGSVPNSIPASNEETKGFDPQVDSLISKVSIPTLSVFLPSPMTAKAASVIICPGGGYQALLIKREGKDVARAFNAAGIAAFVLKYRLPDGKYMKDKALGPLQDAQRSIQIVRDRAAEWGIDPHKIGIMGFSAGGHLAATAGTHYTTTTIENNINTSLRPDFMILINPVISFTDSIGHVGSRNNLLGPTNNKKLISFYSNESHVSNTTPPSFIAHATDDTVVPVANSVEFFNALRKHAVSAELHVYAAGDHGFLKNTPPFGEWFGRCLYWLKSKGLH